MVIQFPQRMRLIEKKQEGNYCGGYLPLEFIDSSGTLNRYNQNTGLHEKVS